MSMSKKDFIALGDFVASMYERGDIKPSGIKSLADFCETQNPLFKRDRWLGFVARECGPNGGAR